MTIDDRLRGTYRRRLHQVEQRVATGETGRTFQPSRPGLAPRLALAGVFAIVIAVGALATSRLVGEPAVPLDAGDAGAGSTTSVPAVVPPEGGVDPAGESDAERSPTDNEAPAEDGSEGAAAQADESPKAQEPTTTIGTAATSEDGDASSPTSVPQPADSPSTDPQPADVELSAGVSNTVCPTGARAELEWAALRYVGSSRGWGRMDDLVDEQDGPYYFEAWEPNFAEPVSVEITLVDPVLATELRVAQDPFTEVGGTITVLAAETIIDLELSGVGGWQVHEFAEPTVVQTITITRSNADSNIMELMVCVAPNP